MMYDKKPIFGEIIECDADNTLTVQLDNGEIGIVPQEEIGRRAVKATSTFDWMLGRRYGFFASDSFSNGHRILSSKAYEDDCYKKIVNAFFNNERNVYAAHLCNVLRDGKVAFFQIAQGVNASLTVNDFALTRVANFHDIVLPRDMTVAIKEITSEGHIRLCGKPAFGDFAASIDRLNITMGSEVEGLVTSFVPSNNDAIVTLAPNLTVLTSPAPVGTWVKVKVFHVKHDEQRIKGEITERMEGTRKPFLYSSFCVDHDSYPAWLNLQEFEKQIGPRKRAPSVMSRPAVSAAPVAPHQPEISYELSSFSSPFVHREGEMAIRSPLNGGTPANILFEAEHGYLNEKHMQAAKVINEMRYCTTWQLQRYLHLKHDLVLSDSVISSLTHRLVKLDIINTLHFSLDGHCSNQPILYPSARLYSSYTGAPRALPNYAYTAELDPAQIKCYLSANQLLLGMMHSGIVSEVDNRVFMSVENGPRLRSRYKVITKTGDIIYLESVRSNDHAHMLDKLSRYAACLSAAGEHASVAITLEDECEIAPFVERVADLHLEFDVLVTCDLKCLPDPVFITIPAHVPESRESGLFSRIRNSFVNPLVAKFMR